MDASTLDRPMGRVMQLFLTCFGLLLGVLVIGSTLAVLAISDARHPRRATVTAEHPTPAPAPSAVPVGTPADPVASAQRQVDALVTTFAQSVDVAQRRTLLVQIRQLAATPGVTVPYR